MHSTRPVMLLSAGKWCFVMVCNKCLKICLFWTANRQTYASITWNTCYRSHRKSLAVWAARFAADVSSTVVMERKHTVTLGFTANRNRNILKAAITMMCWTEIIPSTLISHQIQCRRDTLICYYRFLLKLFFNTILITTKSPTNVSFSCKSEMKLLSYYIYFFFIKWKLNSCYRKYNHFLTSYINAKISCCCRNYHFCPDSWLYKTQH